jgi:argininosuccinate lyase
MSGVLDTLIVHTDRMREMAAGSGSTASNLADAIVRARRLSYRQAHHVVARLVRIAIEENIPASATSQELLDRAAMETIGKILRLKTREVRDALDLDAFVETRVTTGSINPDEVKRMIREGRAKLATKK